LVIQILGLFGFLALGAWHFSALRVPAIFQRIGRPKTVRRIRSHRLPGCFPLTGAL
jgi:hypothetical protein